MRNFSIARIVASLRTLDEPLAEMEMLAEDFMGFRAYDLVYIATANHPLLGTNGLFDSDWEAIQFLDELQPAAENLFFAASWLGRQRQPSVKIYQLAVQSNIGEWRNRMLSLAYRQRADTPELLPNLDRKPTRAEFANMAGNLTAGLTRKSYYTARFHDSSGPVIRLMSPVEHCTTCPTKARRYPSWADMVQEAGIPGDGSDECFFNCKCRVIFPEEVKDKGREANKYLDLEDFDEMIAEIRAKVGAKLGGAKVPGAKKAKQPSAPSPLAKQAMQIIDEEMERIYQEYMASPRDRSAEKKFIKAIQEKREERKALGVDVPVRRADGKVRFAAYAHLDIETAIQRYMEEVWPEVRQWAMDRFRRAGWEFDSWEQMMEDTAQLVEKALTTSEQIQTETDLEAQGKLIQKYWEYRDELSERERILNMAILHFIDDTTEKGMPYIQQFSAETDITRKAKTIYETPGECNWQKYHTISPINLEEDLSGPARYQALGDVGGHDTIFLNDETKDPIHWHEYAHHVADTCPWVRQREIELMDSRCANEPVQTFKVINTTWKGRRDKFPSAYMGRDYLSPQGTRIATEIMSEGAHIIYGSLGRGGFSSINYGLHYRDQFNYSVLINIAEGREDFIAFFIGMFQGVF